MLINVTQCNNQIILSPWLKSIKGKGKKGLENLPNEQSFTEYRITTISKIEFRLRLYACYYLAPTCFVFKDYLM